MTYTKAGLPKPAQVQAGQLTLALACPPTPAWLRGWHRAPAPPGLERV